eukprot:CAMPEP_0179014856 /NCGR_PEP_ID=MMETSP0796-20121207/2477_1 /TAXON_ID=73915 /ORGANISM="Pyrodinium bahamense, Strain pbaha01" /LENGTH=505 /DNA_ID=CAMNT_0020710443 /DNA_START=29 /DNA_END=1546 /DNA_ORIENTATION=+
MPTPLTSSMVLAEAFASMPQASGIVVPQPAVCLQHSQTVVAQQPSLITAQPSSAVAQRPSPAAVAPPSPAMGSSPGLATAQVNTAVSAPGLQRARGSGVAVAPQPGAATQPLSGMVGPAPPQPPPLPDHIKALGDQIRMLKEQLKASGMKAKDIKKHPQVEGMVVQLDRMKVQAGIDPKTNLPVGALPAPKAARKAPPPQPKSKPLPPDLQAYGLQLRALKDELKRAGLSEQQIKSHPQVAGLTAQLNQTMRIRAGAFPKLGKRPQPIAKAVAKQAVAPSKPSLPLPPQIQAFKNNLVSLKNALRASGLTAQQIKGHTQVVSMSATLNQMISAWKGNHPRSLCPQGGLSAMQGAGGFAPPQRPAAFDAAAPLVAQAAAGMAPYVAKASPIAAPSHRLASGTVRMSGSIGGSILPAQANVGMVTVTSGSSRGVAPPPAAVGAATARGPLQCGVATARSACTLAGSRAQVELLLPQSVPYGGLVSSATPTPAAYSSTAGYVARRSFG